MSPKLLRPLVEVDVRAEDAKYGGMDKSSWFSASDPMVDERPRFLKEGLDRTERAEFVESFRNSGGTFEEATNPTVERAGEGSGETWSWPSEGSDFGVSAGGNFGRPSTPPAGCETLGGKGKRGVRDRVKRGIRNRFAVVTG